MTNMTRYVLSRVGLGDNSSIDIYVIDCVYLWTNILIVNCNVSELILHGGRAIDLILFYTVVQV